MKSLKITQTHGKIWTVETSSGARAVSSTLAGALDQLVPASEADMAMQERPKERYGPFLQVVLDAIPDSGGDGNITHGRAAG